MQIPLKERWLPMFVESAEALGSITKKNQGQDDEKKTCMVVFIVVTAFLRPTLGRWVLFLVFQPVEQTSNYSNVNPQKRLSL